MNPSTKLLDKAVSDLTLRDSLKINLGVVAAFVAIPVAIGVVSSAKNKISNIKNNRKMKNTESTETK
jgi:hypothetical protein